MPAIDPILSCLAMDIVQHWQTAHRAYEIGQRFVVKRELRPSELKLDLQGRKIPLPGDSKARLENEFLILQYLHQNSNVPVPKPISFTEEAGIATLTTSCVGKEAVALSDYAKEDRDSVIEKIGKELVTEIIPALRQHTSHRMGGMNRDEQLLLPPRVTDEYGRDWSRFTSKEPAFVLCHNDLGQSNIFIDPNTNKIRAIIDWEYAGYYPPVFEAELWGYHPCEQDWDAHRPEELWRLLETLSRSRDD